MAAHGGALLFVAGELTALERAAAAQARPDFPRTWRAVEAVRCALVGGGAGLDDEYGDHVALAIMLRDLAQLAS